MMIVSQAHPAGAATPTSLNTNWELKSANTGDGLRYQQRFTLTLPTGGLAEQLLIHDAAMQVTARKLTFNALLGSSPETASVIKRDNTRLLVTLPVPRLIHGIQFASSLSPLGKFVELYRTDGDTVADDPVASRRVMQFDSQIGGISVDVNSGVSVGVSSGVTSGVTSGEVSIAPLNAINTDVAGNTGAPQQVINMELAGSIASGFDVIDGRIVVRLKGSTHETLQVSSLTQFNLETSPENFRLGVSIPQLGSDIFYLPLLFEAGQQIDAGPALKQQLLVLIQRLQETLAEQAAAADIAMVLPDPLQLELVVESDAPCRFAISQFAVQYSLRRQSFPGGEAKKTLRFAGGKLDIQQFEVEVPVPASVIKATVKVAGDGIQSSSQGMSLASLGKLTGYLNKDEEFGIRLDQKHRWSSPVVIASPVLVEAWDLLIRTLSGNTDLYMEIVADLDGAPAGDRLASAEVKQLTPGRLRLERFHLQSTLILQPGKYWINLEGRDGSAIWHLHSQPGVRIVPWNNYAGETTTDKSTVIEDMAGIANYVVADGSEAEVQRFPEITLNDTALALSQDGNDWIYDFTSAISLPASSSGLTPQLLSILASGPKSVTIYPPSIEYDI